MSVPQTPSTVNFIQAQAFVLSGSGSSIGDTTLILQSMVGIDGNNIVTADLGSFAYGTLEPGNGTQEEAILFTGVTQNANGTATLTGVSSIGFKQPYAVTAGLTKTHAGASKFILSNDAAFYNNFTLYLNAIAGAGAANASTAVKGLIQAATAAQVQSQTPTGSTGAVLAVTPDVLVNSNATGRGLVQIATTAQINSATATGSTGAPLAITPDQLAASKIGSAIYKLGETILGGNATSISVSSFAAVNEIMIVAQVVGFDAVDACALRFNGDTGNNYTYRFSANGAADTIGTSQSRILMEVSGSHTEAASFICHVSNRSASVKLPTWQIANGSGVSRAEGAANWNNTSAQITTITLLANGGNNILSGSRLTIYGA